MPVHLILLIHGLYGSPKNLSVTAEELHNAALPSSSSSTHVASSSSSYAHDHQSAGEQDDPERDDVVVHIARSFTGSHTWDGIDVNAERAARELDTEIERLEGAGKRVDRVSVMGYSLGGLVARYLAGLLYAREGFFERHRPVSFSTAATPHLGVVKYGSTLNTLVHTVGRRLFSRSGQQLYCLDRDWDERAILEVLADPDLIFLQALKRFSHVAIVANGCHDLTVPYPTATFSLFDPFEAHETTGMQVDVDENHIVRSWQYPEGEVQQIKTEIRRRPMFPPILYLRWPFTYLLVCLVPFILPIWFTLVSCVMLVHTFQSRRRHRLLSAAIEPQDSATRPLLKSPSASSLRIELLRKSTASSLESGANTPDFTSGHTTPALVEVDIPEDIPPRKGHAALLLTPAQKVMCRNLDAALPHAERIIGWFPWAYNAHALLVARDVRRFKGHEEGRGVVRQWARSVVAAGRESHSHARRE